MPGELLTELFAPETPSGRAEAGRGDGRGQPGQPPTRESQVEALPRSGLRGWELVKLRTKALPEKFTSVSGRIFVNFLIAGTMEDSVSSSIEPREEFGQLRGLARELRLDEQLELLPHGYRVKARPENLTLAVGELTTGLAVDDRSKQGEKRFHFIRSLEVVLMVPGRQQIECGERLHEFVQWLSGSAGHLVRCNA
jgi:hypothetical protein